MDKKQIIVNRIITPDGTELISKYRHDYVTYIDKNGLEYMVDGGTGYLRRNVHEQAPYTEASLYSDDDFKILRDYIYRGGRGKEGNEPLKYVKLSEINNNWLDSLIEYEEERRPNNEFLKYYKLEKEYRVINNIKIEEL